MTILILEDEPKAARELQRMLISLPFSTKILASLKSVEETISWLAKNKNPDLILADIVLTDGLVFDLFRQVSVSSPIIFCTAYNQFALDAFRNNGVDYLVKPISDEQLAKSISRLFKLASLVSSNVNHVLMHMAYRRWIAVMQGPYLLPVPVEAINYIRRIDKLVYIYTKTGSYILDEPLDKLASELDPRDFYRANRQVILNKKSIKSVEQLSARKLGLIVEPATSEPLIISKEKSSDFLRWLDK